LCAFLDQFPCQSPEVAKFPEDSMKKNLLCLSVILSAFLPFAQPARAADDNALTGGERAAGWRLLFNGSSLSGWRSLASAQPGAGWKAIDGSIVRTASSGDIVTVDEFGDFELTIDWKVESATNSGILYRVALGEKQTYYSGPEYQVLDDVAASDRFDPKHRAGALYDLVAPPKDFTRPVGSWNTARIIVRGWHIQHWLNGEKIVDVDLRSPEGAMLKMHSKFSAMPHFAEYRRGHIALQDEHNSVAYRNIKIRDLAAAP
jgi:hypothetical protein